MGINQNSSMTEIVREPLCVLEPTVWLLNIKKHQFWHQLWRGWWPVQCCFRTCIAWSRGSNAAETEMVAKQNYTKDWSHASGVACLGNWTHPHDRHDQTLIIWNDDWLFPLAMAVVQLEFCMPLAKALGIMIVTPQKVTDW